MDLPDDCLDALFLEEAAQVPLPMDEAQTLPGALGA
jgi:hypothetical protein